MIIYNRSFNIRELIETDVLFGLHTLMYLQIDNRKRTGRFMIDFGPCHCAFEET